MCLRHALEHYATFNQQLTFYTLNRQSVSALLCHLSKLLSHRVNMFKTVSETYPSLPVLLLSERLLRATRTPRRRKIQEVILVRMSLLHQDLHGKQRQTKKICFFFLIQSRWTKVLTRSSSKAPSGGSWSDGCARHNQKDVSEKGIMSATNCLKHHGGGAQIPVKTARGRRVCWSNGIIIRSGFKSFVRLHSPTLRQRPSLF